MNLYYAHPHWLFDHPDLDLDHDQSFFVIADTPRDALELWMNQINAVHDLTLAYSHQLPSASADLPKNSDLAKRCIHVRDLTFDLNFASPQLIDWDNLQPQSFILKEF